MRITVHDEAARLRPPVLQAKCSGPLPRMDNRDLRRKNRRIERPKCESAHRATGHQLRKEA